MKYLKQDVILKVSGLTKKYGNFTAVDNLDLEIHRGEVFGFLGPNGAGKTTSISMMCGLLTPDHGDIRVNNESIKDKNSRARQLIGLCPQNITVWESLTCLEQLEFMGQMYDVGGKEARKRGLELLEALGLIEKKNKFARTLSGGMQRRLNIALALIHHPEIIILDEPQAGLDPQSRVLVRDYIRSLARKVTVILTTHDMDEAERLSDRVAIIDKGKLLVLDTPDNLKKRVDEAEILEVRIGECKEEKVRVAIERFPRSVVKKAYRDGIIKVSAPELLEIFPQIAGILKSYEIKVEDIKIRKMTLEDVFIALTGRGLRE